MVKYEKSIYRYVRNLWINCFPNWIRLFGKNKCLANFILVKMSKNKRPTCDRIWISKGIILRIYLLLMKFTIFHSGFQILCLESVIISFSLSQVADSFFPLFFIFNSGFDSKYVIFSSSRVVLRLISAKFCNSAQRLW